MNIHQLTQFAARHWILASTLIAIVVLIIAEEARALVRGVKQISTTKLTDLMNHHQGVVVDIRERKAFDDGHIIDAINLPLTAFKTDVHQIEKYKSRSLIIVYGPGQDYVSAGAKLQKQNFEELYILSGGFKAWKSAKLPLAKG